jgi:hypothetical protein
MHHTSRRSRKHKKDEAGDKTKARRALDNSSAESSGITSYGKGALNSRPIDGLTSCIGKLGAHGADNCTELARETGLEPAASAVTGRRSNQLSYSRGCPDRTLIRKQALTN